MSEVVLKIDGMHCGSCIRRVTQALNTAGPFEVTEVRLGAARLHTPESSSTPISDAATTAIAALAKAGYKAHLEA